MHIEAKTLFEFNCIWRLYDAYVKPQNDCLQNHKHTHSRTHDPLFIKNAQNHERISMLFSSFMLCFFYTCNLLKRAFFFPTRKLVQNYVMTKICLPFQLCTCLCAGFMVSDGRKAILIKWTHFKLIEARKKVLTKI